MTALATVLLAALVELPGVTGTDLRARAFFDANNVRVGDPLVLTIDFLGEAEFRDLHPPVLSKVVDRRDWKLDDASAKTDTFRDARRITYRVRPMRPGVLWFPAVEFSYDSPAGPRVVRANEIPVHAKAGAQVVVAEMGDDASQFPKPPELVTALGPASAARATDDVLFAWRKACAKPTADAFAAIDFPEAQLNAATCALREGNGARALKAYGALEWRIGQTPEIERGIVAALALKYDNPQVELPVWRQVLRPVLRYGWAGRLAIVLGGLFGIALVFWLLGRGIRAVAALAFALLLTGTLTAETIETVSTNANGTVTHTKIVKDASGRVVSTFTSSVSHGGSIGGRLNLEDFDPFASFGRRPARRADVRIGVTLESDRKVVTVGEKFNLLLTLDVPRYVSLEDGLRLTLDESGSLRQTAEPLSLANARSPNSTNVLQRMAFPMQAMAPISGPLHWSVAGSYVQGGGGFFGFARATPFATGARTCPFSAKRPPDPPDGYSGIVSEGLRLFETCDLLRVGTNDVVTITYRLQANGFVPKAYVIPGAAFEWGRDESRGVCEYRRFWVADGAPATPRASVLYYDPVRHRYGRVEAGGTPLVYRPEEATP